MDALWPDGTMARCWEGGECEAQLGGPRICEGETAGDPRMTHKEANAPQKLPILHEIWTQAHPQ
jgi:hypothetical protein